jgi:hypothetical protein
MIQQSNCELVLIFEWKMIQQSKFSNGHFTFLKTQKF